MTYSLNDISGRESFILCDSSITSLAENDVLDYLNTTCGYNELDELAIKKGINLFQTVNCFLEKTHITVLPEVKKELQRLIYKLERKKNEFDKHKNSVIRLRRSRNFKFVKEFESIETVAETLFNDLYNLAVNLFSDVGLSVYSPANPVVHKLCTDLVCLIEDHGHCRKPYKYQDDELINKKNKLHTDEKLIATALYRSFFESKSTAIVTGDDDFLDIFSRGIKYIFSDDVAFNTFFLEHFIFFPVNLYVTNSCAFDLQTRWGLIGCTKTPSFFSLVENPVENRCVKHDVDGIMRALMKHIKNSN